MRSRNSAAILVLTCLLFSTFTACSDNGQGENDPTVSSPASLLRQKLRVGNIPTFKINHYVKTVSNGETRGSASLAMVLEMKVTSVEEGTAVLEGKMTRMFVNIEEPKTEYTRFDSECDVEESSPLGDFIDLVKSKTLIMKIDPRGRQVDVQGLAAISEELQKAASEFGNKCPSKEMAQVAAGMYEMFPACFIWKNPCLPVDPVQFGAEWKEDLDLGIEPPSLYCCPDARGKLASSVKGIVTLEFSGIPKKSRKVPGSDDSDPMAAYREKTRIVDGEVEGRLEFDRFKGIIRKRTLKLSVTTQLEDAPQTTETVKQILELIDFKAR